MKRSVALLGLALLIAALPVLAQSSAGHDLSWHLIGSSNGRMMSAGHQLRGSVGQPLIATSTDAHHRLHSGFWQSGIIAAGGHYTIYLPLVARNY